MKFGKEYHRLYSQKRNRKRFKATWLGESDEEGFMTKGKTYIITEVKNSVHFIFVNNFGKSDLAHATWFETTIESK